MKKDSFSIRNKFEKQEILTVDGLTDDCQNRLWNKFEIGLKEMMENGECLCSVVNKILDFIGKKIVFNTIDVKNSIEDIEKYWYEKWSHAFDILEVFLTYTYSEESELYNDGNYYLEKFNKVLEEETSGYRFINDNLKVIAIKITNENEIKCIEESIESVEGNFSLVNNAIEKAVKLYSLEPFDYENSIKESISAVESMCKIILDDSKATLGGALQKLQESGIYIHNAMIEGFKKLYGYTSDESGIRHGGINFSNVTEEDARYMLITCSAFINYLKTKFIKIQNSKSK